MKGGLHFRYGRTLQDPDPRVPGQCNGCEWLGVDEEYGFWYICWHPDGHFEEELGNLFGLAPYENRAVQRPAWCPLDKQGILKERS